MPFSATFDGVKCVYIGFDGNETIKTMEDFQEMNDYYKFFKYRVPVDQLCGGGEK